MSQNLFIIKVFQEERLPAFQTNIPGAVHTDIVFADPAVALATAKSLAERFMREWEEDDEVGRFTITALTESYDKSVHGMDGFVILDGGLPSERWVITPMYFVEDVIDCGQLVLKRFGEEIS